MTIVMILLGAAAALAVLLVIGQMARVEAAITAIRFPSPRSTWFMLPNGVLVNLAHVKFVVVAETVDDVGNHLWNVTAKWATSSSFDEASALHLAQFDSSATAYELAARVAIAMDAHA